MYKKLILLVFILINISTIFCTSEENEAILTNQNGMKIQIGLVNKSLVILKTDHPSLNNINLQPFEFNGEVNFETENLNEYALLWNMEYFQLGSIFEFEELPTVSQHLEFITQTLKIKLGPH